MNTTLKGPARPTTTTQRVSVEFRLNKLELDLSERYRRGVAEVNATFGLLPLRRTSASPDPTYPIGIRPPVEAAISHVKPNNNAPSDEKNMFENPKFQGALSLV